MGKTIVPFRADPRAIILPVWVKKGKKRVQLKGLLDTGASTSVMDMSIANKLGMGRQLLRTRSALQVKGRITEFSGVLDSIEIGGIGNRICKMTGPFIMKFTDMGAPDFMQMLIGMDLIAFMKFKMTFSPKRAVLECQSVRRPREVTLLGKALGIL